MVDETLALQYPDGEQVRQAYRQLPRRGRLLLSCRGEALAETLQILERSGFCAIQLNAASLAQRSCDIRAYKGKQGPCYETGRTAHYLGAALAALDDDDHLLVGSMRVCEKTGGVYQLPPYAGLVRVDDADPALLARLDSAPQDFDCNTLERDAERVLASLRSAPGGPEPVPVLYTGPFRALILSDGSILRRGQAARIPSALARALQQGPDAVLLLPPDSAVPPAEDFAAAHRAQGAACLLGQLPLEDTFPARGAADLTALRAVPDAFRERLGRMIERGEPQIVLVGSDPRDDYGCCPNAEVGAANRLVEAGILDLWRAPTAPDACPTGIYAFAGEMQAVGGRPQAQVDTTFRATVAAALDAAPRETGGGAARRRILRWLLILTVLVLLVVGLVRRLDASGDGRSLEEIIAPAPGERWGVVVLRYGELCEQCENLRGFSAAWVAAQDDPSLAYDTVETEDAANAHLKRLYGLFTTTVLLVELRDGRILRAAPIDHDRALSTYHDRALWQAELAAALADFRAAGGP